MKLSKLIADAQEALATHGDIEVLTENKHLSQLTDIKLTYVPHSVLDVDGIVIKNDCILEIEYDN